MTNKEYEYSFKVDSLDQVIKYLEDNNYKNTSILKQTRKVYENKNNPSMIARITTNIVDDKEEVKALVERGIAAVGKENMLLDPDCGLRKVDIPIAKEKLRILSDLAKEFN
jgi:5-methyltetrahydropteroyltriglutamate--homocysteine methyltransferase